MYYYLFDSEPKIWHSQYLYARPVGDARLDMLSANTQQWWDAEPLTFPPQEPLEFSINAKAPLLDNYATGTLFDLYSGKLVQMLRDADVNFESFPAILGTRRRDKDYLRSMKSAI